jgi:uncharacterized protein YjbI with pentapeptide repeats
VVCWQGEYHERIMELMRWLRKHKTPIAIVLGVVILIVAGIWFWGVLEGYIDPRDPTDRKDVVQAFALIVAGVVALLGGIVSIANLRQQRALEEKRSQEDAKRSYFEQMGNLLTEKCLIDTDREDIKQLAQAQTHTVLARLDGERKGVVIRFLQGAGLINEDNAIVSLFDSDLRGANLRDADLKSTNLSGADLSGANLSEANLSGANLSEANLSGANLSGVGVIMSGGGDPRQVTQRGGANLREAHLREAHLDEADLSFAHLRQADLRGAELTDADLKGADLKGANVTQEQLRQAASLDDATMPDGQMYEDWLKDKEGGGENTENSRPS